MGPVGHVPSNCGDHGAKIPSNFCNWLPFFDGQCGKLTVLPQTSFLNGSKERNVGKGIGEEWVEQQRETGKGRRRRRKGIGIDPT